MYPIICPGQMAVSYCPLMYRVAPDPYQYYSPMYNLNENNRSIEDEQQETTAAPKQSSQDYDYTAAREEEESKGERDMKDGQMPPMGQPPTGIPMQPKVTSAEILRIIDTQHPDMLRTLTSYRIPPTTARQVVNRVIELTLRHSK